MKKRQSQHWTVHCLGIAGLFATLTGRCLIFFSVLVSSHLRCITLSTRNAKDAICSAVRGSIILKCYNLNTVLRGHYAYYGIAGIFRALQRVHRAVERY
jgi:hypothetical protein